jgi:perosamine synthetase
MIPIFEPEFTGKERDYLLDCIDSGWISSQGRYILDFEAAFAARAGMPFGVAVSNCTTALHLALVALGVGPGDEVLCPDLTFIAPANMIALTGATPVLVDVEPVGWGLDPARMEEKITPRTKAVVVVHAFGHVADMGPILALAARHGLKVVEDVAEAPDALWIDPATGDRRVAGSMGDASCYSFFANKIMTTGEGGMVLCRDAALDKALRIHRDHGMSREQRYVHEVIGFNYRMTNMQAAIGLGQLERMDDIQARRSAQEAHYRRRFAACAKLANRPVAEWCQPVHWLTTVTLPDPALRAPLMAHLRENGVEPRPMIFPVHEAAPYVAANDPADFPVSRAISYASVHLPSANGLSAADIDRICDLVIDWVEANHR